MSACPLRSSSCQILVGDQPGPLPAATSEFALLRMLVLVFLIEGRRITAIRATPPLNPRSPRSPLQYGNTDAVKAECETQTTSPPRHANRGRQTPSTTFATDNKNSTNKTLRSDDSAGPSAVTVSPATILALRAASVPSVPARRQIRIQTAGCRLPLSARPACIVKWLTDGDGQKSGYQREPERGHEYPFGDSAHAGRAAA